MNGEHLWARVRRKRERERDSDGHESVNVAVRELIEIHALPSDKEISRITAAEPMIWTKFKNRRKNRGTLVYKIDKMTTLKCLFLNYPAN